MPLKLQKVLQFIPFVNFMIYIFWYKNLSSMQWKLSNILRPLFSIFVLIAVISIFRIVFDRVCDSTSLKSVITWISTYLYTVVIAVVLVREQALYLKCEKR